MKRERIHLVAVGIETGVFLWLGILLVGIVTRNITRFFVIHRLKPFIAGAGVVFLLWGIQNLGLLSAAERKEHTGTILHHDTEYFFQLAVFFILVFLVSIPVFRYLKPGIKQNTAAESGSIITRNQDGRLQPVDSPQNSSTSYENAVVHTFTASSERVLDGYYPEKKQIVVSDTEGAGWVKEIAAHTSSYIGWSVTMKGCVVTDPSVFGPGMFCPSRELMTCCVADLSLIGFTCLYDTTGPFAGLIQDGAWVTVTGTVKQGEYQGEPEPQLICTAVKKAAPPDDQYLYP